jgi:hypothetical protein
MKSNRGNETCIQHSVDVSSVGYTLFSKQLPTLKSESFILGSSVVIMTVLRAERLKNRGSMPGRVKVLSSPKRPGRLGGPTQLLTKCVSVTLFQGFKGLGPETDNSFRLGMSGAIPPLHHVLSWLEQGRYNSTYRLVISSLSCSVFSLMPHKFC